MRVSLAVENDHRDTMGFSGETDNRAEILRNNVAARAFFPAPVMPRTIPCMTRTPFRPDHSAP